MGWADGNNPKKPVDRKAQQNGSGHINTLRDIRKKVRDAFVIIQIEAEIWIGLVKRRAHLKYPC